MNRARLRGVIDRRRMWLSVIALSSWPCMQLARLLLGGGGRGLIDGVNKDSVSHYFSPFWVAVSFFSFFSFLLARHSAWNTLKSCGCESVLVHLVTREPPKCGGRMIAVRTCERRRRATKLQYGTQTPELEELRVKKFRSRSPPTWYAASGRDTSAMQRIIINLSTLPSQKIHSWERIISLYEMFCSIDKQQMTIGSWIAYGFLRWVRLRAAAA